MIAGFRTSADARLNALAWTGLNNFTDHVKGKLFAELSLLEEYQNNNPTALTLNVSSRNIIMPSTLLTGITTHLGYTFTTQASSVPGWYTEPKSYTWVKVLTISW